MFLKSVSYNTFFVCMSTFFLQDFGLVDSDLDKEGSISTGHKPTSQYQLRIGQHQINQTIKGGTKTVYYLVDQISTDGMTESAQ